MIAVFSMLMLLMFATIAGYVSRKGKPKRILDDLGREETITTSLRLFRIRGIVLRTLRHPLGAVVAEKPHGFECLFQRRVRGVNYEVVLRIDLNVRGVHRADGIRVRAGVTRMSFPGTMTDPALRAAFGDVAILRRRVIGALSRADITATKSIADIKWAHRTHCVQAEG